MSTAVTNGIMVSVRSQYIAERSSVTNRQFAFSYTVKISNQGDVVARLESRHWIITDAGGHVEEVNGPGVVGVQPRLKPGESFEYSSWCVLRTTSGQMHGTYQMVTDDGGRFDAEIAPFRLGLPQTLN